MMATLRRFIALLLRTMAGARSHRKTGTHFSGSRSKTWSSNGRYGSQKGSPAKRPGHTLLAAAQYSKKSPENNGLFAICLGIWARSGPYLDALGDIGRI